MKKRIYSLVSMLVLMVGLVFTLVACGESADTHIFIYNYADTYIGSVREDLAKELKDLDVKAKFHDAAESQDTQNTQIDNAIAAGAKLLVVNIVEPGAGDVVVAKAKDAGLPIIFFNREVEDSVIRSYEQATFIGTDPDEAGYMQGELVATELLKNFDKWDTNDDGKINYVMMRADLDNPEANGRTEFSVQEANRLLEEADKPKLNQLGEDFNAGWATDTAKTAMDNFIEAHGLEGDEAIEVVFANNDDMALGVIQSLKAKGYNGDDASKQVLVVGVDATATAMEAINDGSMFGTVKQDGEAMAEAIAKFINNSLNDKDFTAGTDYKYSVSLEDDKAVNKLRIPYALVTK